MVVTTWSGGVATGILWGEAGGVAQHPAVHRTAPATKNDPAQMSIVPRVGHPDLDPNPDITVEGISLLSCGSGGNLRNMLLGFAFLF